MIFSRNKVFQMSLDFLFDISDNFRVFVRYIVLFRWIVFEVVQQRGIVFADYRIRYV